jgi:hypothetical protein
MRCADCSISLICWAGALEITDGSRTFLCPYCGTFACSSFRESETTDAYRAGLRGFHCEMRPLTDELRDQYRFHRRGGEVKVSDPAGKQAYIILRACPFCHHEEWNNNAVR